MCFVGEIRNSKIRRELFIAGMVTRELALAQFVGGMAKLKNEEFVTGMAIREFTTSAQLAMPFTNVREWSGPLGGVREWTRFVGSTEHLHWRASYVW